MKALAVFLVLLFVGVGALSLSVKNVSAQGLLWSSEAPTVLKNIPLAASIDSSCDTYRQNVYVAEYKATRNACIDGDQRLKIVKYLENGRYEAAVGFAYSTEVHVLSGICSATCYYSANTDTLVTTQPVSQFTWGLVVFRHVSSRIKPVVSPLGTSYTFDTNNPDYMLKNDVGRYIATPSFNTSENGKWIVVELRDKGTAIINVATFSSKQITAEGYRYGYGMDPTEQLAVSNDGSSVVVTGNNAGFRVFDVVSGCGQALVGELDFLPTTTACPSTDIGLVNMFPNFHEAQRPRFFGDGRELEVAVTSWVDGTRKVTFATHNAPIVHQLKLLSLGDSFSSGEGEVDSNYYLPGTNTGFDRCHVSTRAYSSVIAEKLGIGEDKAKNVACSGARISDVVGSDDDYEGQGGRLGAAGLKLSMQDRRTAKQKAINTFQPGRTLQDDFIQQYDPEIITIGVGGNDSGLMGKISTCAMPGTCEWAQPDRLSETAFEIRRLYDSLGSLFTHISDETQVSQVFVVGYPDSISTDGVCDPVTNLLIDHTEKVFIKNSIHYLNKIVRAAANKAGFHYVDIENSFEGKKLCDGILPLAMNGVRTGSDIALIGALPMLKIIGAETFHPTPLGHALIANTFLEEYPLLEGGTPNVGDEDITPSAYWNATGESGNSSNRSLHATDFALKDTTDVQHMAIVVPDGTLQPFSTATIEVHSDALQLVTLAVNENGGVNGEITIPPSLNEGFHTLHLLGTNRGDELIDMYQFLTIGKLGSVVGLGDGEDNSPNSDALGSADNAMSSQRSVSSGSEPSPMDLPGVLGAQSTAELVSAVQKNLSSLASPLQHLAKSVGAPLLKGVVAFGVCVLIVCIVLFFRRWAKRNP